MDKRGRFYGFASAIASALFMGMVPIFGKLSITSGFSPLAVVAFRSGLATLFMFILMLLIKRQFFYIYSLGLIGCFLAGFINGIGSILFYSALSIMDAGLGQLIYSFYPIFTACWLLLDRQPINRLTILCLCISIPGILMLTSNSGRPINPLGVILMIGASILYSLHIIINQRILYEVPAPTVTFYTLLSMAITVTIPYILFDRALPLPSVPIFPLIAMALITFLSRLTLFAGVKHLGGLKTAILGLGELLITVFLAHSWLEESFTTIQWIGAGLVAFSMFLVSFVKYPPVKKRTSGLLAWLNPPHIRTDFPLDGAP